MTLRDPIHPYTSASEIIAIFIKLKVIEPFAVSEQLIKE